MAVTASREADRLTGPFETFIASRREPPALETARRAALERVRALGLPGPRQEAWRHTDLGMLVDARFEPVRDVPVAADRIPPAVASGWRAVFVNGVLNDALSRLDGLPQGVQVRSLAGILQAEPGLIGLIAEEQGLLDHPFAALNLAFWADGAWVDVAPGVELEQPLHLVFVNSGHEGGRYPRVLVRLGRAAHITVLEEHCGEGRYVSCPVTDLDLADGARLAYQRLQAEAGSAVHLAGLRARLGREARLEFHSLGMGAALARLDVWAALAGEHAEADLQGLVLAGGRSTGDHHVRVEHNHAHGSSRQVFKGVLRDRARAVFDGTIFVAPGAQKTSAAQTSRNLLLSRQAKAQANPRLEILADDVKCSHGSTTGYLDPDALFYLRTRGIAQAAARQMMVEAFARDILEAVSDRHVREHMEGALARAWTRFLEVD